MIDIEKEKEELQARLAQARPEYIRWQTIVIQLEGAILFCDEMIKKQKDGKDNDI